MQIHKWLANGFCAAIVLVSIMVIPGCRQDAVPKKISLENRQELKKNTVPQEQHLRIAVGGMITPRDGFIYYRQLIDYIGKKTGIPIEFVDREKYEEVNHLLKIGDVDVAFVCSGPYVDGRREFGMELLAAPQAYGQPVYYSYIIVHKDSPVTQFEELRGKAFAFADPDSNSGKLVPEYMLAVMNETPDTFFSKYVYTYGHDKSIKAVAQGLMDGAAVDSLIWDYANARNPQLTAKTKIIKKSPPYGIPPVVVRPGLDVELKKKLKNVLLSIHSDPEGREILKGMLIDKFVDINDSAYNSVREMKTWVGQRKKARKAP